MNQISQDIGQKEQESLRLVFVQKTYELMTAAFSLVAALAWNDAIQSLFSRFFGSNNTLLAKFIYAFLITAVIVWLGYRLNKTSKALEKILKAKKEVN